MPRVPPGSCRARGREVSGSPSHLREKRTRHRGPFRGAWVPCRGDRRRRCAADPPRRRTARSRRAARVGGPCGRAPAPTPWPRPLSRLTCCRNCPDRGTRVVAARDAATVRRPGVGAARPSSRTGPPAPASRSSRVPPRAPARPRRPGRSRLPPRSRGGPSPPDPPGPSDDSGRTSGRSAGAADSGRDSASAGVSSPGVGASPLPVQPTRRRRVLRRLRGRPGHRAGPLGDVRWMPPPRWIRPEASRSRGFDRAPSQVPLWVLSIAGPGRAPWPRRSPRTSASSKREASRARAARGRDPGGPGDRGTLRLPGRPAAASRNICRTNRTGRSRGPSSRGPSTIPRGAGGPGPAGGPPQRLPDRTGHAPARCGTRSTREVRRPPP